MVTDKTIAPIFLIALILLLPAKVSAQAPTRISRPALQADLAPIIQSSEPNREPIASEPPGVYRSFLVWRQRFAHLALCPMTFCHGTCIEYGDGCLARAQNPVLPFLIEAGGNNCGRSAEMILKKQPAIEGVDQRKGCCP